MSDSEDDDAETLARFAPFAGFARIARRHFDQMNTLVQSLPPEPSPTDEAPDAHLIWGHETHEMRELVDEHAAITIIFACTAAELYINDAAARLLGDTYFEKHIDRIDIVSKWVLVPRIVCGHQIDRGGEACNLLRAVVSLRNELMHPKSGAFTEEKYEKSTTARLQDAATKAVKLLAALLKESKAFDRQDLGTVHL